MRQISDQNALYEMARLIASQKAAGRHYREDVISEAYLALADGASTKRQLENAVRSALRAEWADEDHHMNLQISDSVARQGAPERARPDLWKAMADLQPVQRATLILTFWYGLTQDEVAEIFGCSQRNVGMTVDSAIRTLKKKLTGTSNSPRETAVGN
jgi:RNA polymerase sigma factor (sigma-70 family)